MRCSRQQQVLHALTVLVQATDKQLASHLGWPINCVTPRRLELVRKDLVIERGVVRQKNGKKATLWTTT